MILVLGYWVLGDIHTYWIVLVLGDIFGSDTQYNTSQTAVSTVHMPANGYLVPLVTCEAKLTTGKRFSKRGQQSSGSGGVL